MGFHDLRLSFSEGPLGSYKFALRHLILEIITPLQFSSQVVRPPWKMSSLKRLTSFVIFLHNEILISVDYRIIDSQQVRSLSTNNGKSRHMLVLRDSERIWLNF